MAYTLQALISDHSLIEKAPAVKLKAVPLTSSLAMIPLPFDTENIPFLPLADEGQERIEGYLAKLCLDLSKETRLAYVEAEIFGGDGTQAAWLLESGNEVRKPFKHRSAINDALRWLGVLKGNARDEFESIQLGRHRNTSDWIKNDAYQDGRHNGDKRRVTP